MLTATPVPQEAPLRDDQVLVSLAKQGDGAAFAELLQRHDDKMRGVVWRVVRSRSDMDDVLQEAYLKAWRRLASFRGDSAFSSWLYSVVYTTAIDQVRAASRRPTVPLEIVPDRPVGDNAQLIAEQAALRQALGELPADQLAVVALVDGEGYAYDSVAEMLGISPGTVGSRLSRARARLRQALTSANPSTERGA